METSTPTRIVSSSLKTITFHHQLKMERDKKRGSEGRHKALKRPILMQMMSLPSPSITIPPYRLKLPRHLWMGGHHASHRCRGLLNKWRIMKYTANFLRDHSLLSKKQYKVVHSLPWPTRVRRRASKTQLETWISSLTPTIMNTCRTQKLLKLLCSRSWASVRVNELSSWTAKQNFPGKDRNVSCWANTYSKWRIESSWSFKKSKRNSKKKCFLYKMTIKW